MAQPKQTEVRDKSAKAFFCQIPHLVLLLPMHPYSKLVYWELKRTAEQFAHDLGQQSEMLKGKAMAKRLRISESMVSDCKKELVAFQLITILVEGIRDIIEIEDIWDRNKAHFAGKTDPMMGNPPTSAAYKTSRKHVRKPVQKQTDANANPAEQDSLYESSNASKIRIANHEDSYSESSQTTGEVLHTVQKEVLEVRTGEEEKPPSQAPPKVSLQPQVGNPVAAPNAPNPPRKPRKPNLTTGFPTTTEQEPRLSDQRIISFNALFGREKLLSVADIDEICERVRPDEQDQWAAACKRWSESCTADGRPYRIDLDDSVSKLISFHLRNLRAKPPTAQTGRSTQTLSPQEMARKVEGDIAAELAAGTYVPITDGFNFFGGSNG